ncbi:K(+)-transporting ATPase subunit F [Nonomuraea sp. NPDC004580]
MSAVNATGLVVAAGLVILMVTALVFPERF